VIFQNRINDCKPLLSGDEQLFIDLFIQLTGGHRLTDAAIGNAFI
jgi:hypothetical protein